SRGQRRRSQTAHRRDQAARRGSLRDQIPRALGRRSRGRGSVSFHRQTMTELAALVRFVHLAAAVLLFGSFAFAVLIARPACQTADDFDGGRRSLARPPSIIARGSLLVIFFSAVAALWIQSVNVSEAPGRATDVAALYVLITTTQFGRVWLARMIVALLIGALLLGEPRKQASSAIGDGAGAILSALLLAAVAFAGHASAADGPAFVLQVCVDALHLLATGL